MPPAKIAIIPRHAIKPTGTVKIDSVHSPATSAVARNVKPSIVPVAPTRQFKLVKVPMTPDRVAVIQRHAMKTDGVVKAGSFTARVQAGSARNVNAGIVPATPTGKP